MKKCIAALVDCDGVLLLPDFFESRGAIVERDLARGLEIPVFHDIKKLISAWKEPTP